MGSVLDTMVEHRAKFGAYDDVQQVIVPRAMSVAEVPADRAI